MSMVPLMSTARTWSIDSSVTSAPRRLPRGHVVHVVHVRVNGIAPDSIETPMMGALAEKLGGGDAARRRLAGMTPLGRAQERLGTGEEVAALATFLLAPEAGWVTGTIVPVDGGILAADVHHPPPPD